MVVIPTGSRTMCVQRLVEEGCKRGKERVPIHRLPMADRTAVDWDPTTVPGNVTIKNAQVKETNNDR